MAGGMGPPAPNAKTKGDNCMTVKRNFIYLWLPAKNEILYIREISGSLMSGERESYNEPHYYYKRYAPEDNGSGGLAIVSVGEIPQDECGNKQRLNEAVQDILEYIYGTWDFSKVVLLEEKKEYLKVGSYTPGDEENPPVIDCEAYGQGFVMKDEEAYEIDPGRICYVPELTDSGWCHKDFLELCNNQEEFARMLFDQVDWQSPSTLATEMFENLEWGYCSHCKKIINMAGEEIACPYCGGELGPMNE